VGTSNIYEYIGVKRGERDNFSLRKRMLVIRLQHGIGRLLEWMLKTH
jgi:hypothetical protein